MPYGLEISGIAGTVIVVLVAIASLRLTYFRKNIEQLSGNVETASQRTRNALSDEIKKGAGANVEAIIGMVNSLSPLDQIGKSLEGIDASMQRGFLADMVSIGLLVAVAILSIVETTYDPLTQLFIFFVAIIIFSVVLSFVQSVNELFKIEKQLKEPKKK